MNRIEPDAEAEVEAGSGAGDGIDRTWWKEAVVYQIYPRSFNDSDGDGIGDLPGIVEKVDHLDDLGADLVWLCPVYDSPGADNGYDIRDYRAIDPTFGTMADFEALLEALHARDIRLIMDLVVNHTSDEHEWFRRSRRREGRYEKYYYWRDGGPDEPPNNWTSFMGGSAWTYDEVRGAWYLHLFDEKQPDLNWRNPDVRAAIVEMVTWWLEKGIDGFRMDAINYLSKPEGLPDGDPENSPVGLEHVSHGPRIHEYLRELYDEALSASDAVTVAEMSGTTVEMAREYLGEEGDGLDMIFHFEHMGVDLGPGGRWDPEGVGEWDLRELKEIVSRWQNGLDGEGWNSLYLGNHDQPRIVSRFGDEAYRTESATLLATFLSTLRGTPYIYQGDEIGMTNVEFGSLSDLDDPMTIGAVADLLGEGDLDSAPAVRTVVNAQSRDHARTPMQWESTTNAGFSEAEPWFPANPNYTDINVAAARGDPDSVLQHYRRLIDLRHAEDILVYGEYDVLCPDHERIYAYTRTLAEEVVLIVLNWSTEPTTVPDDVVDTANATEATDAAGSGAGGGTASRELLYGNYDDPTDFEDGELRPYEALVYRL